MTAEHRPTWPAIGVAAKAIVRRKDGRFLLIRRALDVNTDPGRWDLPGGKMDYGETLRDALVREVREETGFTVTVGPVVHICHFTKEPFWVTCVTFACEYDGGEVRLSDEHIDFAWIDLSGIPNRTYGRAIREQLDAYAAFAKRQ
jgi:8-oxo-dGTP diphosphatase